MRGASRRRFGFRDFRWRLRLVSIAAAILSGSFATAQENELVFAHSGGAGSLAEACVNEFARRVNTSLPATGFRLAPVGDSRRGEDTVVLQKLKSGEVTLGLPSTVMSAMSDKFAIFELPFLIRERAQMRQIGQNLLDGYLQPEVHKNGYRILAIWENGFRHITNNVRPIRQPEDLRGLRIRIPKGPWREKLFRALGAEPVIIPLHETYAALASRSVDGQENPLQQIKGAKFGEVQRYLTYSEHIYTPAYVTVGEEAFAKLPPEVQRVLNATAADMQDWVYQTALRMESDLIDEFEEKMQTNQLDIKAFQAATRPLYGEFVRTVEGGAKMIAIAGGMTPTDSTR
jgi:tripartite ATP-independent transporter DctP family solute receptor